MLNGLKWSCSHHLHFISDTDINSWGGGLSCKGGHIEKVQARFSHYRPFTLLCTFVCKGFKGLLDVEFLNVWDFTPSATCHPARRARHDSCAPKRVKWCRRSLADPIRRAPLSTANCFNQPNKRCEQPWLPLWLLTAPPAVSTEAGLGTYIDRVRLFQACDISVSSTSFHT